MKSVCFVVQSVYDFDPRVRRKAEALVAMGYSVDVLALRPPCGRRSYSLRGVNVRTVSLGKKRGSLRRYFFEYAVFFLWALWRVSLQMAERRYAAVDINTLPDFLVFAGAPAKWMGARLILDLHEITPEFFISKYGIGENARIIRLLTWLEKVSVGFADYALTISEPVEDLLVSRGLDRSKSTIVMNSADETRFAASGEVPLAPQREDRFIMMYHGTLTKIYGLDIAIKALALARQEMPDAELWILGTGPEKDSLAELAGTLGISNAVRLLGQATPADIPGWLSQCDAGVLPIRRDVFLDFAFPNKLPEFIIAGKPVIVSRLKAINRYFSDDAVAYFEPNDPGDLAEQMARLRRDSATRSRLARNARMEYAPIRWDVMKRRYLELIARITGAAATVEERPESTVAVK